MAAWADQLLLLGFFPLGVEGAIVVHDRLRRGCAHRSVHCNKPESQIAPERQPVLERRHRARAVSAEITMPAIMQAQDISASFWAAFVSARIGRNAGHARNQPAR